MIRLHKILHSQSVTGNVQLLFGLKITTAKFENALDTQKEVENSKAPRGSLQLFCLP